MLRSFRARLLAAILIVAMLAIGVTAWITNRTTSDDAQRQVEEDIFAEKSIYEELTIYAITSPDWSGAGDLVDGLAADFERRIAVAGLDGQVLADSDKDRPLPAAPVGIVDPANPLIEFQPESSGAISDIELFNAEGKALATFLDDLGIPYELITDEFGFTFPLWDESDPQANAAVEEFFGSSGVIEFGRIEGFDVAEDFEKGEDVLNGVFFDPSEFAEPALLYIEAPGDSGVSAVISGRLLLGILIVAGAATLITILLARRLMRPITALTSAAEGLQTGDLSYRVEVDENGEIGSLAEAFNSMAESLEESDGMRRTMTADIAHELRTPLANIRGYLEAAQEGIVQPDEGLLATVHEEAMMLQHLVEDLETLTQADAGRLQLDKERLSVPDVVVHVADAHRARSEAAGVSLTVVGPDDGLDVSADPVRLRQAIGNLVDNALRHTKSGGTVTIATARTSADVVVTVSDTGDGIPPEHLPHVFDRFYRADPSRNRATGGSGLGLAIVRQIAEAHSGSVEASSVVGAGTTVTLRLPAASLQEGS